ncbi:MAG: hypothetical protein Q4D51_02035 [Eubacteriales bacterium]|nr:hypothetical protein [Eubacteriales bacterium]
MSFKDFLKSMISSYFVIVTLINVSTYVLGSIYRPEELFGYEAFLSPLIYGALGILPVCVMYSKKELTLKQVIFRKILQLILLEVLLIGFGFGYNRFTVDNMKLIISFGLSVFVIFILVHIISWVLDLQQARQMTMDLLSYQSQSEE